MNVNYIIKSLENLTEYEQQQVFNFLEEKLVFGSLSTQIKDGIKESRFPSGKVCPHCKGNNVSRNGKYNGKQRYICKSCNKTFTDFTFSPCYNSKKDFSKWLEYIKCMVAGYSIRKCAEIVEITVPTSFAWRHKILDALRLYIGTGHVSGLVEADETFFRLSYKGNHSKSKGFTMPRKPNLRGPKSKKSENEEPKPRGISRNQVAVMCAIDRSGNIISELICNGRMKYKDVERLFNGRIEENSTLCIDSHKSYIRLDDNFDVDIQKIETGKFKKGIYHIQHINSYHSRLKKWMDNFNGVATKYLANYMYWFKWIELFKTDKDAMKCKRLFIQSHASYSNTQIKDFKNRRPLYI